MTAGRPRVERTYGLLRTNIYANAESLAAAAAADLAAILTEAIARKGEAAVIVATGNSQLGLMRALREGSVVDWGHVRLFHMDEYLGIPREHPASFRRYIREQLAGAVRPLEFYEIQGDAPDPAEEVRRYTALLRRYPADACVMGIGENGHVAFNDPPADFETRETMRVVRMDDACRRQQVGEGHFATVADVPERALTLTVPALMAPPHLLVVVPERRKAVAVRNALEGPVTPDCPASILQRQANAVVYLEPESASLLRLNR